MNEPSAIAGTLASYRTLADGTLRVTVDLNELQSRLFHELFPAVGVEVALAPLHVKEEGEK